MLATSNRAMSAINQGRIYQLLSQQGELSRLQLAQLTGLTTASLTKLTRLLIEKGFVQEISAQKSTGGRRAINLTTTPERHSFIALTLNGAQIQMKLLSLCGQPLAPVTDFTWLETADTTSLAKKIKAYWDEHITKASPTLAITLMTSQPGAEESQALLQALKQSFSLPCYESTPEQGQALAESYFGGAKLAERALVLFSGQSLQAIPIDKTTKIEPTPVAQLGHIQIDPLGEPCHCGQFGCLTTIASEDAILAKVERLIKTGFQTQLTSDALSLRKVAQAAELGDELAQSVMKEIADALAKGLASAINLLAPQKIFIQGPLQMLWPQLESKVLAALARQTFTPYLKALSFQVSRLEPSEFLAAQGVLHSVLISGELFADGAKD